MTAEIRPVDRPSDEEIGLAGVSPSGPDRSVIDQRRGLFERLPWRRADFGPQVGPVVRLVRHHHPKADVRPIIRAYEVARQAHAGQVRKSGDDYITHPVAVAGILADLGMDVTTITASLLHDVVEDTGIDLESIELEFGLDVVTIVDGVTKLDRLRFESQEAQQAATMRKMLVAMAKDVRVLLIKLADRLHNMRTLAPLSKEKRRRVSQETIDIYAPLANRLGISEIKWQLEDLAFYELHPDTASQIVEMVHERHEPREADLDEVIAQIDKKLSDTKIDATVSGRSKNYYSIYEKMVMQERSFDEIFDLIGVRIITTSTHDCYAALGEVHSLWKPVQGRFKDYIAMPKFNLYQSLHTTVIGPHGRAVEVQIRTKDMHRIAEYGIAAHWRYKEGARHGDRGAAAVEDLKWVGRLMEWQADTDDPTEFLDTLRTDLDQDEVFVFTPKGDVVAMPAGSTPVDFAYHIHTEIGNRCVGTRVSGRQVPLDSRLSSGDSVEIFTAKSESAAPNRDWLSFVATPKARNKIRAWFSRERREEAVDNGRKLLERELRRERLPIAKILSGTDIEHVADEMNYQHVGSLYAAIGENHVRADVVVAHLVRLTEPRVERSPADMSSALLSEMAPSRMARRSRSAENVGIHVEGLDDVWVNLAGCCKPVAGDEIMGYVTRGRGVSVHRADCANAIDLSTDADRLIEVEWDPNTRTTSIATIQVEALDRPGLLTEVTAVLAMHQTNIRSAQTLTGRDQIAIQRFDVALGDPTRLDTLLEDLMDVDSVCDAFRVLPGAKAARERNEHPTSGNS